ncbi:MAG TPA: hypothetical protein VFD00_07930, partial [Thermoclostridium sp.]|nr:hypothetical protein [Thermoclostridium sp.]
IISTINSYNYSRIELKQNNRKKCLLTVLSLVYRFKKLLTPNLIKSWIIVVFHNLPYGVHRFIRITSMDIKEMNIQ